MLLVWEPLVLASVQPVSGHASVSLKIAKSSIPNNCQKIASKGVDVYWQKKRNCTWMGPLLESENWEYLGEL